MLEVAASRLPDVPFTLADMRTFDLGRTFDVSKPTIAQVNGIAYAGGFLLALFEFFIFFAWFMCLWWIFGDLFRRHDISGWGKAIWVIVLIVFMCLDGTKGENRFGPDPKDPSSADVFM